jgi:hypothetical protein
MEVLAMEEGLFVYLVNYPAICYIFMALCDILWPFGIFSPFWYIVPRKIWQPGDSAVDPLLRLFRQKFLLADFYHPPRMTRCFL